MNKIDIYIQSKSTWCDELNILRETLNKTELTEDFKWGAPTYTINNKNVIGIAAFKNYVGLWFFQGVFLQDKHKILINAQTDKTKALRQLRYNSIEEIDLKVLKEYIEEAIQNQKEGKEIKVKRVKSSDIQIPPQLLAQFKIVEGMQSAFEKLSPGKQKDYAEYISSAKQDKTKLSRLEKITPMILKGVGLHDKYKNC